MSFHSYTKELFVEQVTQPGITYISKDEFGNYIFSYIAENNCGKYIFSYQNSIDDFESNDEDESKSCSDFESDSGSDDDYQSCCDSEVRNFPVSYYRNKIKSIINKYKKNHNYCESCKSEEELTCVHYKITISSIINSFLNSEGLTRKDQISGNLTKRFVKYYCNNSELRMLCNECSSRTDLDFKQPKKKTRRSATHKYRLEIRNQINRYKKKRLGNDTFYCDFCGSYEDITCDHYNMLFTEIINNFVKENNIDLHDPITDEINKKWKKYHKENCSLRLLCQDCHDDVNNQD